MSKYEEKLRDEIYGSKLISNERLSLFFSNNGIPKISSLKKYMAAQMAEFLCSQEMFDQFYEALSEAKQKLLLRVVFSSAIRTVDAYDGLTIENPFLHKSEYSYYGYRSNYADEHFPYFFVVTQDLIYIDSQMKAVLRDRLKKHNPYFFIDPEEFYEKNNIFSEKKGMEVFNNIYEIISIARNNGFFEREIKQPVLKKLATQINDACHISEFYSEAEEKDVSKVKGVRLELVLKFLSLIFKKSSKNEFSPENLPPDPFELMKELFRRFITIFDSDFDEKYFVPNSMASACFYKAFVEVRLKGMELFFKYFKVEFNEPDKAIPLEAYLDFNGTPEFSFMPCEDNYYKYFLYTNYYRNVKWVHSIEEFSYYISQRASHNLILLLAALGLFEISYDFYVEDRSDFESLNKSWYYQYGKPSFIKLTALGKAVFGFTETFDYAEKTAVPAPELLTDDLIINVSKEDKVFPLFIKDWTKKISDNYYFADKAKILKKCRTKTEVVRLFERLETASKKQLPDLWKSFENSLLSNYIHLVFNEGYTIVDLKDQNREIFNIVKSVASLHPDRVILMDHQNVAVRNDSVYLFKASIESGGFRLE